MEYIIASLVAILAMTLIVYKLANSILGIDLRLRPLLLCAACAIFISLVLPKLVVGFAGLPGTLAVLAAFAVAFAYFVAKFESEPLPSENEADTETACCISSAGNQPDILAQTNFVQDIGIVPNDYVSEINNEQIVNSFNENCYEQTQLEIKSDLLESSVFQNTHTVAADTENRIEFTAKQEPNLNEELLPEQVLVEEIDLSEECLAQENTGCIVKVVEKDSIVPVDEVKSNRTDCNQAGSSNSSEEVMICKKEDTHLETQELEETSEDITPNEFGSSEVVVADNEETNDQEAIETAGIHKVVDETIAQQEIEEEEESYSGTRQAAVDDNIVEIKQEIDLEEQENIGCIVAVAEKDVKDVIVSEDEVKSNRADCNQTELSDSLEELMICEKEDILLKAQELVEETLEDIIPHEFSSGEVVVADNEETDDQEAIETVGIHKIVDETIVQEEIKEEESESGRRQSDADDHIVDSKQEIDLEEDIYAEEVISKTVQEIASPMTEVAITEQAIEQESLFEILEQSIVQEVDLLMYNNEQPLEMLQFMSEKLDDLLDFAFISKEKQDYNLAFNAFTKALTLYPNSEAAPFLIVEIGNILKNRGAYDDAIKIFLDGRNLSQTRQDEMMEQEFISTIAYLRIIKNILLQNRLGNVPFLEIPVPILKQIDEEFKDWRNIGN